MIAVLVSFLRERKIISEGFKVFNCGVLLRYSLLYLQRMIETSKDQTFIVDEETLVLLWFMIELLIQK